MESKISIFITCLVFAAAFQLLLPVSEASLKVGYYKSKCKKAESIVKSTVRNFIVKNPGLVAGVIRMFFHDCFVRCEMDICKVVVNVDLRKSRLDGRVSNGSEALQLLPPPSFNLTQLEASFARNGLSTAEMVTLSGAHSIGRSHCSSFTSRLYPTIDPTMNQGFGSSLRKLCPQNAAVDGVVPQDFVSPNKLDEQYYKNVESLTALFFSDWSLLTSSETQKQVDTYTKVPGAFKVDFANAMIKMGSISDALAGSSGEVRGPTCRAVN
ncbi:peroxidase 5-like protein [Carex littledalei]|uniref:peroxidase n=1 Tax=Carex littledalei TaxID=544730 RepID=A0A833VEL2_9POAL|nr:peroxidase 5-like protein [Carex littledalei]